MSVTPKNIEHTIDRSLPGAGYTDQLFIPLESIGSVSQLTNLTGSTTPAKATDAGGQRCIQWVFSLGTSQQAEFSGAIPYWWIENDPASLGGVGGLDLILRARKYDPTIDENATLNLQATMTWTNPGEATQTLTTQATALLATAVLTANSLGYADYVLKIGARLRAESRKLKRGAAITFTFGPDATVGTTDMKLQVAGVTLAFRRNAGVGDTTRRNISG